MKLITDLHIHSKYSMSTSKDISLESLCKWAQLKGIDVIGTGDFTHPLWFQEIKDKLVENENGLFSLSLNYQSFEIPERCKRSVSFILTTEINCVYKKSGSTRRIHSLIFMPSLKSLVKFNQKIATYGNVSSDGRLTIKLDIKSLLDMVLNNDSQSFLIPAHVWTPHYSIFGSKYGFDSIQECFEELSPHITTLETGLSSDIKMNRRISQLDKINLVSFSDAHSPSKLGREATIVDTDLSYLSIINAFKTGKGLVNTIEVFPQEGKYFLDGHRRCDISMEPQETNDNNTICPKCKKTLTLGVLNRIEFFVDRRIHIADSQGIHSVPLLEIISNILKKGINSADVIKCYYNMITIFGNELYILLDCPIDELNSFDAKIAKAISKVRKEEVILIPGYDGVYGKICFIP
ncbi:MAG: endonuclease Q family protein [Thermodesulfovibrionales bacterium]|nr:endonuclease Q family protein [Thermodesulfovibrionales bacterium]